MTLGSQSKRAGPDKERAAQGELDALRTILVSNERLEIEALRDRLSNPQARVQELSEVLPQAILRRHHQDSDLTRALAQPLSGSIQSTVRRNPKAFADALFPVIGPAIRRAIAEALRGLVQNINRTLDHSLSLRGLRWRWEAIRSDVPFGEVVLRHTLAYRVEQAFLIRPDNGLLIEHVADELAVERDADAVSAMLTAIQSFVKDAFAAEESIDAVEMGEYTVWLVHGPEAYLACAIRGLPPRGLRDLLDAVLRDVHTQYGDELATYDGDRISSEAGIRLELTRCLVSEQKEGERNKLGISKPAVLLLLSALAVAGWFAHHLWQDRQAGEQRNAAYDAFIERIGNTPGYVLTSISRDGERLRLQGLSDPLAAPPETLLANSELTSDQVEMRWLPYHSAEPAIALKRAKRRLLPPTTVALDLSERAELTVRGVAEQAWIERAALLATTIPGVAQVDIANLQSSDAALEVIARERLTPPPSVELQAQSGILTITGTAPATWIDAVPTRLRGMTLLKDLDLAGLQAQERLDLQQLSRTVETTHLMFAAGSAELQPRAKQQLQQLAAQLRHAKQLAAVLELQPRLLVIGRTDGIGDPERNARLALQRTRASAQLLRDLGVDAAALNEHAAPTNNQDGVSTPELRRVEFRLELQPADGDS